MVTESRRTEIIASMTISNVFQIYANLTEEERADPDIAEQAVSLDGLVIRHTPAEARSEKVFQKAIKNCKLAAAFIPTRDHLRLIQKTAA
jgi:hypothetical protein